MSVNSSILFPPGSCNSSLDCFSHGTCVNNICDCDPWYKTDNLNCEKNWMQW